MYFQFNSTTYLQIERLPMGSSLSGTLAILFMDKLECKTLMLYPPYIEINKRYVDYIYVQTVDKIQADNFHTAMNTPHPNPKFEIEKPVTTPTGKSQSLLDFTVTIRRQDRV